MVGNLTGTTIEPRTVTNQSTFSGSTSFANYTYQTDVKYVSNLLMNSSGTSRSQVSGLYWMCADMIRGHQSLPNVCLARLD